MVTTPIWCSSCGLVGLGAVELPVGVDPTPAITGMLCDSCGELYREQVTAGSITPGELPQLT